MLVSPLLLFRFSIDSSHLVFTLLLNISQASPITIGDRQAVVEEKRTTTRGKWITEGGLGGGFMIDKSL